MLLKPIKFMTWVPVFKVSSLDFDYDLSVLKKIMNSFEKKVHLDNAYKFSANADFAMGWWFYEIFVKMEFFKRLVQMEHNANPKIKDERDILIIIQKQLKMNGSKARIKLESKPSLFRKYWTWLLR